MKNCKRCTSGHAVKGELYCRGCRKVVLREIRKSGYLSPLKIKTCSSASTDKREIDAEKHPWVADKPRIWGDE